MAHARKQIRDAVVTALTGLATTGSNVFASRVHAVQQSELPCLLAYSTSEDVQRVTHAPVEHLRVLSLEIKAIADGAAVDDTLDAICAEVEAAIAADVTLGGLAQDCRPTGTEIDLDGKGESTSGAAVLRYEIEYSVREADPQTLL